MISDATPQGAAGQLRALLQGALSCVGRSVVVSTVAPPETNLTVTETLATRSGPVRLRIKLMSLLVSEPNRHRSERWSLRPVRYDYKLDGEDGRELLAYHLHPSGFSHERRPHLHLGAGMDFAANEWQKAHLLTGPLSPVAILEPCLAVLGVPARRPDWPDAFARLAAAFADSAPTDQT